MIHVRSFRTAGKCHGFDISRCQDQIRILSDATQTTIVLCDGAGSSPYGGIAASVAASTLAGNLHLNFEQYLHGALPDIRMQLTRTVDTELKKMAKEMQIDPRLLATTMLAISIDNDGRFVGVHLGDGSILWNVGSSDLLKTVSSPQRGDQPNSTYPTMNCPLFYYLRFYRWTKPGARRIILLSDGMNGLNAPLTSGIFSVQNQDLLNQKMINTRNFDDMSYVLCELDAPCSRQ